MSRSVKIIRDEFSYSPKYTNTWPDSQSIVLQSEFDEDDEDDEDFEFPEVNGEDFGEDEADEQNSVGRGYRESDGEDFDEYEEEEYEEQEDEDFDEDDFDQDQEFEEDLEDNED